MSLLLLLLLFAFVPPHMPYSLSIGGIPLQSCIVAGAQSELFERTLIL